MDYEKLANVLKALAEPNRLKIVDILSCGELCGIKILTYFSFTQPTLSHHLKILERAGVVNVRKSKKMHYYSLSDEFKIKFIYYFNNIMNDGDDCICHE